MKLYRLLSALLMLSLIVSINIHISYSQDALNRSQGDGTLRRIRVPVLMYHYVSELPPNADPIRIGLTVNPQMFRSHIRYLHENGFHTISFDDLHFALMYGLPLPANPVILTFDDGYIDHYSVVFPILQEFGFTGTFFIITAFVDNNTPNYMNWSQVIEMSNANMDIETHTKNHPDLTNRSYDFIVYEILGSIESIESHTNTQPNIFSYPAGRYDESLLGIMQTFPIYRAVTTQAGLYHTTDNYFELPRVRITNETTVRGLAFLLSN